MQTLLGWLYAREQLADLRGMKGPWVTSLNYTANDYVTRNAQGIDLPPLTLDELHEAEKCLDLNQRDDYRRCLQGICPTGLDCDDDLFLLIHATAYQRAEAILRVIGKWPDP